MHLKGGLDDLTDRGRVRPVSAVEPDGNEAAIRIGAQGPLRGQVQPGADFPHPMACHAAVHQALTGAANRTKVCWAAATGEDLYEVLRRSAGRLAAETVELTRLQRGSSSLLACLSEIDQVTAEDDVRLAIGESGEGQALAQ